MLKEERARFAKQVDQTMSAKFFINFALIISCLNAVCVAKSAVNVDGESLIGITVTGETVLDIVKINMADFSVDVILPNATEVTIDQKKKMIFFKI